MQHPWHLGFFIHDTDTCHYTGLKLGRSSEIGREKSVTPKFGEWKEEKILPPNSYRFAEPLCIRAPGLYKDQPAVHYDCSLSLVFLAQKPLDFPVFAHAAQTEI
jgi:hypothetical protein